MRILALFLLAVGAYAEQLQALLDSMPADVLSGFGNDPKLFKSETGDVDAFKKAEEPAKFSMKPNFPILGKPVGVPGKALKVAAVAPLKKIAVKKVVAAKTLAAPKLKAAAVLKTKPKVHSLKPIVHVIEKPVKVYHKVPVPKKVIIPKFYPVIKKIPVPKMVFVPYKVPVKKIIPKIVKIPKAVPIPKIVKVKKPVPIAIPYPVPKYYKVPIPKPVPYKKYIPIPIPKKVPKFIPVPVKKIIKVPKPYYVPVRVPHFSASYIKTPMVVDVPDVKKFPMKGKSLKKPFGTRSDGKKEDKILESILGEMGGNEGKLKETIANFGSEDQELMKLLASGMPDGPLKL